MLDYQKKPKKPTNLEKDTHQIASKKRYTKISFEIKAVKHTETSTWYVMSSVLNGKDLIILTKFRSINKA